jgi:hypothetical protein
MSNLKYPLAEYYRDHVRDGVTISRGGGWWTAVLLIKDPRSDSHFIAFYRWKLSNGEWRKNKSFSIRTLAATDLASEALETFKSFLPEGRRK